MHPRRFIVCALALAGAVAPAIAQPQPAAPAQPAQPAPAGTKYLCPMHCEGEKTYDAPGKCPVCGMKLKPVAAQAYSVEVKPAEGELKADAPMALTVAIKDAGGATVADFTPSRGHPLMLGILARDLSSFERAYPEPQAGGGFRFTTTLHPGEYVLFSDFTPAKGAPQVATANLSIPGKPPIPKAMGVDADRPKIVGDYTVTIAGHDNLHAGQEGPLSFHIARANAPVKDLDLVQGAPGDLVIISQDLKSYVHPAAAGAQTGPDVAFPVRLDQPGLYRGWAEFQHQGKAFTVPFVIEVQAPSPSGL
jgi:hypothetical protein